MANQISDILNQAHLGIFITLHMQRTMHIHVNAVEVPGFFYPVKYFVPEVFKG